MSKTDRERFEAVADRVVTEWTHGVDGEFRELTVVITDALQAATAAEREAQKAEAAALRSCADQMFSDMKWDRPVHPNWSEWCRLYDLASPDEIRARSDES